MFRLYVQYKFIKLMNKLSVFTNKLTDGYNDNIQCYAMNFMKQMLNNKLTLFNLFI